MMVAGLLAMVPSHAVPARAQGGDEAPPVELRGDRQWDYWFAPVYRRFDRLAVQIPDLQAKDDRRLLVVMEHRPRTGEAKRNVVVHRKLHRLRERDGEPVRAETKLGQRLRRLPVGRYRLVVWLEGKEGYRPIAARRFFIIFNAHHPDDQSVYHSQPRNWLKPTMNMVQLRGDEPAVYPWRLDIHDPKVFKLAMDLVDGEEMGQAAASRLITAVREHVDGHWPQLADTRGVVPEASPPTDPDWWPSEVTSAAERLRSDDARGQCFDYAMLYVALLRSVGVPARTITITAPTRMPHPDAPRKQVRWGYHVWAELFLDGRWWASDVTYLDEPTLQQLPRSSYPGLQARRGRWFTRTLRRGAAVWMVKGGQMRDVSDRYRRPDGG